MIDIIAMILGALGVKVPDLGLLTAPVIAFDKKRDLGNYTLSSMLSLCLCFTVIAKQTASAAMSMPSPHTMMATLVFFCCSLWSSVMMTTDLFHRFTRKS